MIGLDDIKSKIEESYTLRNKWSYFIDIDGYGLKYYIKPSSTVIQISDISFEKIDDF
jgi:hypothetical protein